MDFRLIVGLGNPGPEYSRTRHNVGFMILDYMAESRGASFRSEKAWKSLVARAGNSQLVKPQTYMNLSGESVQAAARFYKVDPEQVLVVLDDLSLPLGKLRFRNGGGSGGHRGLQSVLECLGSTAVPRLRVGIGAPSEPIQAKSTGRDARVVDHVLGNFSPAEHEALPSILKNSKEAIEYACQQGLTAAMNQYN
jgi:PTH1 family peptidyl-tRNA hydrolase